MKTTHLLDFSFRDGEHECHLSLVEYERSVGPRYIIGMGSTLGDVPHETESFSDKDYALEKARRLRASLIADVQSYLSDKP
jgi:hypothetical protein